MTAIEYLRSRNVLAGDAKDLMIGFDNGSEESLVALLEGYAKDNKMNEDRWIAFEGNKVLFADNVNARTLCKFDNGVICEFYDEFPIAVMTHFKLSKD